MTQKIYSNIIGFGAFLPEKIMSNEELARLKNIDTNNEWIIARTGIKQRHIATDHTVAEMAYHASKEAIAKSNIMVDDIDMIIVSSCSAVNVFPSIACVLQNKLDINKNIIAFDISAACSAFIYLLDIADSFIRSGKVKTVLIVSSEKMTDVLDWQDRKTCVLFGDGAGAMILQANNKVGIIDTQICAAGQYGEILQLNNVTRNTETNKENFLTMNGQALYKLSIQKMSQLILQILQKNNLQISDIDWLIPHQANKRILIQVAEKLNLNLDKLLLTVDIHANTSSASVPLAFHHFCIKEPKIKKGDLIIFEGFGGGLTWGGVLFRY